MEDNEPCMAIGGGEVLEGDTEGADKEKPCERHFIAAERAKSEYERLYREMVEQMRPWLVAVMLICIPYCTIPGL